MPALSGGYLPDPVLWELVGVRECNIEYRLVPNRNASTVTPCFPVTGQNSGQTSNFQVSSLLTY